MFKSVSHDQSIKLAISQKLKKHSKKYKTNGLLLSSTAPAACGGGTGDDTGGPGTNPTVTPGFTLQNSTQYIGTDLAETLSQGSNTNDLTVSGRGGDDIINTGSGNDRIFGEDGNDTINSGSGDDYIDPGQGGDTVNAGSGDDEIVVRESDFSAGETINGGAGTDTLLLGADDIRGLNFTSIEAIKSNFTILNYSQITNSGITSFDGDGYGFLQIRNDSGASRSFNLADYEITGMKSLHIEENFTFIVASVGALNDAGIDTLLGEGTYQILDVTDLDLSGYYLGPNITLIDGSGITLNISNLGAQILTSDQEDGLLSGDYRIPIEINLNNAFIEEGKAGASISTLNVTDQNGDEETFTYAVSDDRFEVVDDILKLKSGVSISDTSSSILVTITVTDSTGFAYSQTVSLSVRDILNGFTVSGKNNGDQLGTSVSNLGDVNGDGFDDFAIGAPDISSNDIRNTGEVYIIFGNETRSTSGFDLATLDGTNGFTVQGKERDSIGLNLSPAGDINGDGIDDILIGADNSAYIIYGSNTGFASNLDLANLDNATGFEITGSFNAGVDGVTVANLGDINGDAIDDILIGALYTTVNGQSDTGQSYVVFGSNTGFNGSFDLATLNGTNGFNINGLNAGDQSGTAVSSAGDINGDGINDFMIGSPEKDTNGLIEAGEIHVIFGKNSSWETNFDLSTLDGTNGFTITGANQHDNLGNTLDSIGDFNGDGIDDIIVGGFSGDKSYVIFGKNGAFTPSLDVSALDGTNGFQIIGEDFYDHKVSAAGDINGDGINDVIIGASYAEGNFTVAVSPSYGGVSALSSSPLPFSGNLSQEPPPHPPGEVYVIFGKETGFEATFDVKDLDGSNGFVINGISLGDASGWSVSAAGDIDGDGIDDLLIGARFGGPEDNTGPGEAYVIFGHTGGWDAVYNFSELTRLEDANQSSSSTGGVQPMALMDDFQQLDFTKIVNGSANGLSDYEDVQPINENEIISETADYSEIEEIEIAPLTSAQETSLHYDYG